MPCCWVLSYTPVINSEVSHNVALVSSFGFKAQKVWDLLPLAFVELEQEDALKNTNQKLSICAPVTPAQLFWKPSPCFHDAWYIRKFKVVFFHFSPNKSLRFRWRAVVGSAWGLSDPVLYGSFVSPISAIGLLFSDDLFNDKWCVINLTIMLLVFPKKWNNIIS